MIIKMIGPYEILSLIGAGGMGEVWKARDTRLGRIVAIKKVKEQHSERFKQEARTIAALNHPYICQLFDIGPDYLVLEYVEGKPLSSPLPEKDAVRLAIQIATALEAAHKKGVIHRDLKPANIMVTEEGSVKLLDFGLAKLYEQDAATSQSPTADFPATQAGAVLGTVAYMSPEQAQGQPVDERSDIFSFGLVLYEMLSGSRAFTGDSNYAVMDAIVKRDPPDLQASPPLETTVRRCLEKKPSVRYQTMSEVKAALESIAEGKAKVNAAETQLSIVVLPFENLSPDPENTFFADGLTEELIADLSQVRTLRVISRTSAMLLKGSKKDVPTIARDLKVRYVLEGSVRRAGNSLRITAQLIDAANDAHLWAEKYGGTLEDIFGIQERVSGSIVNALRVTLTAEEKQRLAARSIPDAGAFDLYLRAHQEAYKGTESALGQASRLTWQALEITGPNAFLFSLLAEIEFLYHDMGIHRDEESLRSGESWAKRALELDHRNAAAFRALGAIEARRGDMAHALRDLRRARELQVTGETLCFLAWRCSEVGSMAEARRYSAEAVSVDPLLWACRWSHSWVALLDGDFETALKRWQDPVDLKVEAPLKAFFLAIFLLYAGHMDEACDSFGRVADTDAPAMSLISSLLRALFRRDTAAAAPLLSSQALTEIAMQDKEFSWWLAAGCNYCGRTDEALRWLANSIKLGFLNHVFFSTIDPYLGSLRSDARFAGLMESAREKRRDLEG
jgi:serine/threonine protein kinase/tetratricopeptide (TPR) repeat protein